MEKIDLYSDLSAKDQDLVVATLNSKKKSKDWRKALELANPKCTINIGATAKESYVRIDDSDSEIFQLLIRNYIG